MTTKAPKATIVFLDRTTLPPQISVRSFNFPHELNAYEATSPADVAGRIRDADIVITNKVKIGPAALEGASKLRLIAVAATGTDVVDIAAARDHGVTVCNIRNYAVHTVPEHTFALILALRRSILPYHKAVAAGRWAEAGQFCFFDHPIRDLATSTLGIIGDGVLGRAVADIGKAFGMKVLFSDYKGTTGMGPLYTPFEQVLRTSDVLTLHLPLMASTRNLIGPAEFEQMDRKPLLINTARGGLVDESALAAALDSGQIAGAAFDVVTTEPVPADHPFMRLMARPNFILTPHVAWASEEATQALTDQLLENIEAFWGGQPRNVVL